ncbi:PAS domain-containing protein [Paenibacillus hexagrammi]|uniref:PAS domain-containing protein n=1 Tax=Paenibacillus hexagrammi TaxID=2908839 RepID=UPI0021A95B1B|nr:PAS domain S-box protein [Paenibacillus sp. YPD9-1]
MRMPQQLPMESMIHKAPNGIGVVDAEGRFTYVNEAFCRICGYLEEEMLTMTLYMILHQKEQERAAFALSALTSGFQQSGQLRTQVMHKKGHSIEAIMDISLHTEQDEQRFFIYIQTEARASRDQDQGQLQGQGAAWLNNCLHVLEHSLDIFCRISSEGNILYVSPAVKGILGYETGELTGAPYWLYVHPEDRAFIQNYFQDLARMTERSVGRFRLRCKNGSYVWMESACKILRNEQNEFVETMNVFRDITEQKRQEDQLRRNKAMFDLITEHAQDLISYVSAEGDFEYVSPSIRALLGYSQQEIIGTSSLFLMHEEDRAAVIDRSLFEEADVSLHMLRLRHKNGTYLWFESFMKVIRDDEGRFDKIMGIARDITTRRAAEDKLREQEYRYRELVENSPDAVIISAGGKWLYVNQTAVQLFGAPPKKSCWNMLPKAPLSAAHRGYSISSSLWSETGHPSWWSFSVFDLMAP